MARLRSNRRVSALLGLGSHLQHGNSVRSDCQRRRNAKRFAQGGVELVNKSDQPNGAAHK